MNTTTYSMNLIKTLLIAKKMNNCEYTFIFYFFAYKHNDLCDIMNPMKMLQLIKSYVCMAKIKKKKKYGE